MFGVRLSSLFTSRWMALLWCILICLTAIQIVGSGDDDAEPSANAAQDAAAINAVF